jgi:hypothetical protein
MWEERWQPLIVAIWLELYFHAKANFENRQDLIVVATLEQKSKS